jgi:hypothetical protein
MIDPVELMQSDRLLEFSAYFDADRRLWPWMFKRRSRWGEAAATNLASRSEAGVLWGEA